MKWKELSTKLIGTILRKDVHSDNGSILLKKDTMLTTNTISYLLNNKVKRVFVSFLKLEDELLLQLERFVVKSKQPLFWEEYISAIEETKVFFTLLSEESSESPKLLLEKICNLTVLLEDKKEFLELAYSIEGHADFLYRHSINVALISYLMGELSMPSEDSLLLCQMGYLHDIGKSKLDKNITNKINDLTSEEKTHLKNHTILGEKLLKSLGIFKKEFLDVTLLHHESQQVDTSINKKHKNSLPLTTQIVFAANVFDNFCSDSICKKRKTIFQSLNELYFSAIDGKINPKIILPFITYVYQIHFNKGVILSNGLKGQIYYLNSQKTILPLIKLDNGNFIDLSQHRDIYIKDYFDILPHQTF